MGSSLGFWLRHAVGSVVDVWTYLMTALAAGAVSAVVSGLVNWQRGHRIGFLQGKATGQLEERQKYRPTRPVEIRSRRLQPGDHDYEPPGHTHTHTSGDREDEFTNWPKSPGDQSTRYRGDDKW